MSATYSHPRCALAGHGPCDTKISGEHYISQAVLHRLSVKNEIVISGTAWTGGTQKTVGKAALVANILCTKHNSNLSKLDALAARFFQKIQEAQLELQTGPKRNRTFTFSGPTLERWFLKVAFMMWQGRIFAHAGVALPGNPPSTWGEILTGEIAMPDGWGLYLKGASDPFYAADREFSVMPHSATDGSGIKAVTFELARFPFVLLTGWPDDAVAWGNCRPREIDIGDDHVRHALRLTWPDGAAGEAVTFRRIGNI